MLTKPTVFVVDASVPFQREAIGEGGRADVALERLLARVHLRVVLQMSRLTECRTAGLASEQTNQF